MGMIGAGARSLTLRRARARPLDTASGALDPQLAGYAGVLTALGLLMAYSNSVQMGDPVLAAGSTFLRGLAWIAIALVVFAIASAVDYRWLRTLSGPLYLVEIAMLAVTLAVGSGVGGAARWINVGPVTFQFSELAKILMIVVLATYLSRNAHRVHSLIVIVGAVGLVAAPALLVLRQPDLGTSLVFGGILAGMLFMSGASLRWLGALAGGVVAAGPLIWEYVLKDYQRARLISFLQPAADVQGAGYQLYQAQQAIGAGGWIGKGLTNGTPNEVDYLPVQTTDFVFALVGEELGAIGGAIVLALFAFLLWRIVLSAWRTDDTFASLFCCGVASMLVFQVVVNVGMVLGVMPITGIPLPFVTHGGASLVTTALALGVIESINLRRPRQEW
jgi:rod shape determining protein RodA